MTKRTALRRALERAAHDDRTDMIGLELNNTNYSPDRQESEALARLTETVDTLREELATWEAHLARCTKADLNESLTQLNRKKKGR